MKPSRGGIPYANAELSASLHTFRVILSRIKVKRDSAIYPDAMWKSMFSAPFDRDLELAVLDRDGMHPLVFPCRRVDGGWIDASTKKPVNVPPTHWREWQQG